MSSATVGTYVALLVLDLVAAPCSKLAFSDWWATTAGDRLVQLPREALDHRRFRDAMDQISPTQLAEIGSDVSLPTWSSPSTLDRSGLVLDMTNFATDIDSANDKAPISVKRATIWDPDWRASCPILWRLLQYTISKPWALRMFQQASPLPEGSDSWSLWDYLSERLGKRQRSMNG